MRAGGLPGRTLAGAFPAFLFFSRFSFPIRRRDHALKPSQRFIHTAEVLALRSASQTAFVRTIDSYVEYLNRNATGLNAIFFFVVFFSQVRFVCDRKCVSWSRCQAAMMLPHIVFIYFIFFGASSIFFLMTLCIPWTVLLMKKQNCVICLLSRHHTDHPGGRSGRPSVPGRSVGHRDPRHTAHPWCLS